MQKQTVAFSKDSSNLFFHILTKCNLSCTHCYINKDQHGHNTLDIETIKDWQTTIPKVAEAIAAHGIAVSYPKVFLTMKMDTLNIKLLAACSRKRSACD